MGKMKAIAQDIAECKKCNGTGIQCHTKDDIDYKWACDCNPLGVDSEALDRLTQFIKEAE